MKHTQILDEEGMVALEALCTTAALEAFSLRSVTNRAADIIPNLSHAFKQVLDSNNTDKFDLSIMRVNSAVLGKALKSANYLEVGRLNVFTPQGFTGNLKEYLSVLWKAIEFTNGLDMRMTKYNQLLSALISDKSSRLSTKDMSIATSQFDRERDVVRDSLSAFITPGNRSDRANLQDVYGSLNEILDTTLTMQELLEKAMELSMKQVRKMTDDASELIQTLGTMAENKQIGELSNEAYRSLSSATLTMARDVELHSVLMFALYQAKKAVEDNAQVIVKALRY